MDAQLIQTLQHNQQNIRNICILAHVDHGKTTLSDALLASNGIISLKSSGKARYLDSREDEQIRGITMKSSAISLHFKVVAANQAQDYLINLIDSPGHVDFSSEVSTASRLCDGALVLVDAVEGVCTQTHTVLKQAWVENVRPILVLNKIDRLITQLKMSPIEAYIHLQQIIQQVNAIVGTMFTQDKMEDDSRKYDQQKQELLGEWQLDDSDDSHLYFSPDVGNVIFASAIDGWGFRIHQFAAIYARKLGMNETVLRKVLWGDYYLDIKSKRVLGKGTGKPMFVQFVLDNIWAVYQTVLDTGDRQEKLAKIIKSLALKLTPRELKSKDNKSLLQSIMSQWIPLSTSILLSVVEKIPSPIQAQPTRMPKIMYPKIPNLSTPRTEFEKSVFNCDKSESAPVVGFISKVISVPTKDLPDHKLMKMQASIEEIKEKRKKYIDALQLKQGDHQPIENPSTPIPQATPEKVQEEQEETLIGFARIYSGTIKIGQSLTLLSAKSTPSDPSSHISFTVTKLYLLMGRELESLDAVPAGNVFGLGGLDEKVLKTATFTDTPTQCPSFGALGVEAMPILRVALEPEDPTRMTELVEGLRLLNMSDPCVEVSLLGNGEHVIGTAGELHLERCLKDLRERFAKIKISASEPIVPFQETISLKPSTIDYSHTFIKSAFTSILDRLTPTNKVGSVIITTPNKLCTIRLHALPLPFAVTEYLCSNESRISMILDGDDEELLNDFLDGLKKSFDGCEGDDWDGIVENIWAFGGKRVGSNVLVNRVDGYIRKPWGTTNKSQNKTVVQDNNESSSEISIKSIQGSIASGFQLATSNGPLTGEPMTGVCFVIEEVSFHVDEHTDSLQLGLLSGQIISTVREACRLAFLDWSPRLLLAMYSCDLQCPSEVLGKVYAVIAKRRGQILSEEMKDGTPYFHIKALIPVIESFGFSEEVRKRTSGAASPQLIFQGFKILDQDPFWIPTTEEELEDLGEKADRENLSKRYMEQVRRRKGLFVERKIVEHAEKQKTMKNK